MSFASLQSTSGLSTHTGVQSPQNFGQYITVGGESGWLQMLRVAFISRQLMSMLSLHGSWVDPVGGVRVVTGEPSTTATTRVSR